MDKTMKVDQMGRLRGFIKGLVYDRTVWIILGSVLYFLGWDSIWSIFTLIYYLPSINYELFFTCFLLLNILVTILLLPLIIYAIQKLKPPLNRKLWYAVWIVAFGLLGPGLILAPYPKTYTYLLTFLNTGDNCFLFLVINATAIIVPFGLMIRPPELQRYLRLVSIIVLGIWGLADGVGLFYLFQASGESYFMKEIGSTTEVRWGVPLILAGIVVWLVSEILEWRSQKPGDAAVKEISA